MVNFDDIHFAESMMMGKLPAAVKPDKNPAYAPGIDLSGAVDAVGAGVNSHSVDQEVCGISNPMAGRKPWAEYCVTKKPESWSFPEEQSVRSRKRRPG